MLDTLAEAEEALDALAEKAERIRERLYVATNRITDQLDNARSDWSVVTDLRKVIAALAADVAKLEALV